MPNSGLWRPPSTVVPRCSCARLLPHKHRVLSPVSLVKTGGVPRPHTTTSSLSCGRLLDRAGPVEFVDLGSGDQLPAGVRVVAVRLNRHGGLGV